MSFYNVQNINTYVTAHNRLCLLEAVQTSIFLNLKCHVGQLMTVDLLAAFEIPARVARWYILKQKIPIWVNFGVSRKERCWYIL
jgi:hypothetical protein